MQKRTLQYFLVVLLASAPGIASAQNTFAVVTDTNKLSIPLNQAKQLSSATAAKVKQVNDALNKKLDAVKKPSVTFNFSIEEALKYQPPTSSLIADPTQNFVNNVYLRGTVQAFGIPLNLNYSNDHTASAGPGLGGVNNNLFKLDFNPAQFAGIFKSDMQQYYDLRKNAFGGLDMGTYARNAVQQKLKEEATAVSGKANSSMLSQYLSDPAKVSELLRMSDDQIRQKLTAIAQTEAKKEVPVPSLNAINTNTPLKSVENIAEKQLAQEQQNIKERAAKELTGNTNLGQYLNQPGNIKA